MHDSISIADATLNALISVDTGQYADRALNEAVRRYRLQAEDRLEAKRWLYRTLRWRARFDSVLQHVNEFWQEPLTRAAGRLALAANFDAPAPELLPALAECLTARGRKRVAALLPNLPPLAMQTPLAAASLSAEALAEAYSHPVWIVERFLADRPDEVVRLLEANNAEPPVVIRTNSLKTTREELQAKLAAEGIATTPGRYSPLALHVTTEADIFRTDAFRDGLFELQDEASQLIGWVLDPKPRGLVVDACAGAGGKSLLLACLLKNRARILSVDIYEQKLERLRERARRAGVSNLQTQLLEAGGLSDKLREQADAVLVDAPCSGLGALRRNPDAKWRLEAGAIEELAARQYGIMLSWAEAIKRGGLLVYSTCTLSKPENQDVIAAFLKARPDFEIEPATARLPAEQANFATPEGFFTSLPHRDGTDGFFAARLRRKTT